MAEVPLKISDGVARDLRCPICRSELKPDADVLHCAQEPRCHRFPIVDGVPILIHEENSLFSICDYQVNRGTYYRPTFDKEKALQKLLPDIGRNLKVRGNYARLATLLLERGERPRVLIIGGRVLGEGMEEIASNPAIEFVETDVCVGPRVALISDAHDIPFADSVFDGVIVQAVLEHVLDPYRCVGEIHRVLKSGGLVYADTPFMQQVHGGRFDYTRYTYLGYRRLFRQFEEVASGASSGPGMALAWSYTYFLRSFATRRLSRALLRAFARLTSFWLKYFDYYLIGKPGAMDAAAAYFFLGKKSDKVLTDRELITLYRGLTENA